jgi:hypothetical protein
MTVLFRERAQYLDSVVMTRVSRIGSLPMWFLVGAGL